MTNPSAQSLTAAAVASGVLLLLFMSLGGLEGVNGLAIKTTYYDDEMCELASGVTLRMFGFPALDNSGVLIGLNECNPHSGMSSSLEWVCDVTTGGTGGKSYADDTCTKLDTESVIAPGCTTSGPGAEECPLGGICTTGTVECTDDVALTISPNVFNFIAVEYHDAGCTDPTGNTVVISASAGREGSGECVSTSQVMPHVAAECRADGSYIVQMFVPTDDTCSGDVWYQSTLPAEYSPPWCSSVAVDGLYYGYVSCTTDAATVSVGTTSPAAMPTFFDGATAAPFSTTYVDDDASALTPAPTTTDVDSGAGAAMTRAPVASVDIPTTAVATPGPTADVDGDGAAATPAPTTDVDDDAAANSLAPVARADDGAAADTPAPEADAGSRGISATAPPTAAGSGSGEVEDTPPPIGSDEASLANGAAATGGDVSVWSAVLSCAVGLWVFVAM